LYCELRIFTCHFEWLARTVIFWGSPKCQCCPIYLWSHNSVLVFLLARSNPVIENFPTVLCIVLLHGIFDAGFFSIKLLHTLFFHKACFAEVFQRNSFHSHMHTILLLSVTDNALECLCHIAVLVR